MGITIPPASVLQQLSLPHDTAVAYVGKLYVSYALQGHGYGGATMRAVEALARHQLGAQMCVLDCIVHDYQMRPDVLEVFYVRHGNPAPKVVFSHLFSQCLGVLGVAEKEVLLTGTVTDFERAVV